ncbi:MAG: molybdopterin molybdenumtransferase MoeA, partial [Pseudomonadota bacterium]
AALPANGPREHYMRASLSEGPGGPHLTPADSQDSALLSRLATADVLIIRAPHQPAAAPGESVEFIPIRG